MALDLLVHDRVGEHRLVAFVVTKPAVAEDVEHHVLAELLAELGGDPGGVDHRLGIVSVDVEDRRFDHQGDVGRVGGRAAEVRRGGEPDLVVDHDMNGAARLVTLEAGEAETFGHHALTGEGGIAVQQDRQNAGPLVIVVLVLFGAGLAENNRVDRFQMRGVRRQAQVHRIAVKLAI